jgi:8-oxo-dGTP diphosphatase
VFLDLYNLNFGATFLISQKAVIFYKDKILVLGRRTEKRLIWELPGGLLEIQEEMIAGLMREVKEETGLTIKVNDLFTTWDHNIEDFRLKDGRKLNCRIIELAYKCCSNNVRIKVSNEHDVFEWACLDDLTNYTFHENSKHAIDVLKFTQ